MGRTLVRGKGKERKNKVKIFYETMIFFNEALFTSYCCVRYFHKKKNNTLYLSWISSLSFF